ncbi:MAG: hypothetical protein NC828_00505, partial [Candidatus Omnitrophica bacterium]|nr:hypothetical protein [Candidatus Omnitrophota bacterium]
FDDDGTESRAGKLGVLNFFDVCLNSDVMTERAKAYLTEFEHKKTDTKIWRGICDGRSGWY